MADSTVLIQQETRNLHVVTSQTCDVTLTSQRRQQSRLINHMIGTQSSNHAEQGKTQALRAKPPSDKKVAPVVKVDSSESMCAARAAISSGRPARPTTCAPFAASSAFSSVLSGPCSGVATYPGARALTRMPAVRLNSMSAAHAWHEWQATEPPQTRSEGKTCRPMSMLQASKANALRCVHLGTGFGPQVRARAYNRYGTLRTVAANSAKACRGRRRA